MCTLSALIDGCAFQPHPCRSPGDPTPMMPGSKSIRVPWMAILTPDPMVDRFARVTVTHMSPDRIAVSLDGSDDPFSVTTVMNSFKAFGLEAAMFIFCDRLQNLWFCGAPTLIAPHSLADVGHPRES